MNAGQIIGSLISQSAKRKLEERVLEIAGKGAGRTTPDMIEVLELAEEMGEKDSVWILREKFAEIGEMQARRSLAMRKNRTKRDERERRLEDYVQTNIQEIEQGLEFVGRQDVLHSGRTDVTAMDADGREVVIELKMNGYDPVSVSHQLMKYLGEKDESRLIFVAPEIKPDLYFALKAARVDDRISFMIVNQEGEDFSFEKFNGDFGEIQKVDFTRSKKDSDEDTVEIVRAGKARDVRKRRGLEGKAVTGGFITTQELAKREPHGRESIEAEGVFSFSEKGEWTGITYAEIKKDMEIPDNWNRWYKSDRELLPGEVADAILKRGYRDISRRSASLSEHSIRENLQGEYEGAEKEFFFLGRDPERIDRETRRHLRNILKLIGEKVKVDDTGKVYSTTEHVPDGKPKIVSQGTLSLREMALFRIFKGMPTYPITNLNDLKRAVQTNSLFPKRYFEGIEIALRKADDGIGEEEIQDIIRREAELPEHVTFANYFFSREIDNWILERREITEVQGRNLERLADNSRLVGLHTKYTEKRVELVGRIGWDRNKAHEYISSRCTLEERAELHSADIMASQLTTDRLSKVVQMANMISNGFQSLNPDNPEWSESEGVHLGANFEQTITFVEQRLKELNGIIARYMANRDVKKSLKILKRIADDSEGIEKDYAENQRWFLSGLDCDVSVEEIRLKLQRTRALMDVDPRLAMLYLAHSDKRYLFYTGQVDMVEETLKNPGVAAAYSLIRKKMQQTNSEHYRSIINTFFVRDEPADRARTAHTPAHVVNTESDIKSPEISVCEAFLGRVLENGKNGYSEDTLARIRYFAEDAKAYGFDDKQMEKLAESIKGVNLHKRLRNREARPSDTQLRNFFDDITLKYVMHGSVPDIKDLERVYEETSL